MTFIRASSLSSAPSRSDIGFSVPVESNWKTHSTALTVKLSQNLKSCFELGRRHLRIEGDSESLRPVERNRSIAWRSLT